MSFVAETLHGLAAVLAAKQTDSPDEKRALGALAFFLRLAAWEHTQDPEAELDRHVEQADEIFVGMSAAAGVALVRLCAGLRDGAEHGLKTSFSAFSAALGPAEVRDAAS